MKVSVFTKTVWALPLVLLPFVSLKVNAQKYPKLQEVSLRAPDNVKIDGKLTELDSKFQAYNYADRLFYTLSNDDDKLYVTIQAGGPFANDKILNGGITFIVSHSLGRERMKDPANVSITYPMLSPRAIAATVPVVYNYKDLAEDPSVNASKMDSLVNVANRRVMVSAKDMQVIGVEDVTDPLISIYNKFGIRVNGQFNSKMLYTYRLAIPLKSLGLAINDNKDKFSYSIRLNAPEDVPPAPMVADIPLKQVGYVQTTSLAMDRIGILDPDTEYKYAATYFWGVYTLAKK